ncbi:hypothetical protein FQA39_LY06091 [Lamprigera yunnana]|nr:hypothetical protein FQA39_LY06091 [Lamprigera yunnana]
MDETAVDMEGADTEKYVYKTNLPSPLTLEEKKYLLAVERGDIANVKRILQRAHQLHHINVDCVDSFGRSSLTLAIDGENLEMVELLVVMGVKTKDGLLHAINAEFVEAVELLLEHEELIHEDGGVYSWQTVDLSTASFTPDVTPLILAAHKNNYEILKILLDRGAAIPMPHDIKCGCDDCIKESKEDSLRQALTRLNEYKALASPSLIALSSSDPILTAFQLSWELRNLAFAEPECRAEYLELRRQCQQFAVDLLHQSRSSKELAIILNHDPDSPPYVEGDHMNLARLELAITYKQKKFVAHPNIQQLLAAIWYEGVPGFRRKSSVAKLLICIRTAVFFPLYCTLYMLAPNTNTGKLMRKPFMKFLIHASSYLFFLFILILVSQRAEDQLIEFFGTDSMKAERFQKQRGNPPAYLEYVVLIYVIGYIYEETYEIYVEGIKPYLRNLWNSIDFTRNFLYCLVCLLRVAAYLQQRNEIANDPSTAFIPREKWNAFDPQLIAEGLFAAANIFSALKLVHLFSINPHLGPLQISLGRMVIDIVKFFFIYSLVLFAFACGLNQLLWYFSDLERQKCFVLPNGEPDWENRSDSCMKWRSFANVFEASQSLFWASFGFVDLSNFDLTGIKTYTRFWGLLMYGSYSVINVIVLLNLLIAMMSNSYAMIDEHSDTEWKFARTKLWLSYFEEGNTLPPPFNLMPTLKTVLKTFKLRKKDKQNRMSMRRKNREEKERDYRYTSIMRALVWRYISTMHKKMEEDIVTEDDINEVKGDISGFRYDILEVLSKNGMNISCIETKEKAVLGKKMKMWERQLMKDFKVAPIVTEEEAEQLIHEPPPENEDPLSKFKRVAKLAVLNSNMSKWGQVVSGAFLASQIGHCSSKDSFKKQQNLLKAMEEAQRIVSDYPIPRATTPMELPDITGQSIMAVLRDKHTPFDNKGITRNVLSSMKKKNLQPNVVVTSQPSITLMPATPKQERYDKSENNSAAEVPDFITLESPKSPSIRSFKEDVPTILEGTTCEVKTETSLDAKVDLISSDALILETKSVLKGTNQDQPLIKEFKADIEVISTDYNLLPKEDELLTKTDTTPVEDKAPSTAESIIAKKTPTTEQDKIEVKINENTTDKIVDEKKKIEVMIDESTTDKIVDEKKIIEVKIDESTTDKIVDEKKKIEVKIDESTTDKIVDEKKLDDFPEVNELKTKELSEKIDVSLKVKSKDATEQDQVPQTSDVQTERDKDEQDKVLEISKDAQSEPDLVTTPKVIDQKADDKKCELTLTESAIKEKEISELQEENKPQIEEKEEDKTITESTPKNDNLSKSKEEPNKKEIESTTAEETKVKDDPIPPVLSDAEIDKNKTASPSVKETSPAHSEESETGSTKSKSRKAQAPAIPKITKPVEEIKESKPIEVEEARSPLTSRNITRIGDKKPRRQARTGWL